MPIELPTSTAVLPAIGREGREMRRRHCSKALEGISKSTSYGHGVGRTRRENRKGRGGGGGKTKEEAGKSTRAAA
eukprot:632837-Hanusia_phi.AAC.1